MKKWIATASTLENGWRNDRALSPNRQLPIDKLSWHHQLKTTPRNRKTALSLEPASVWRSKCACLMKTAKAYLNDGHTNWACLKFVAHGQCSAYYGKNPGNTTGFNHRWTVLPTSILTG